MKGADEMRLLFSEDFATDELNSKFWNAKVGNKWANNEQQAYTDRKENLYIKDGCLHIRGICENYMERYYTSARVDTFGKFSFNKGLVEVEACIPSAIGSWPAIWLMPVDQYKVGWPRCGEIDIMEHCGYKLDDLFFSIHTFEKNHVLKNGWTKTVKYKGVSNSFHKYGFLWEEKKLTWLVDDEVAFVVNRPDDFDETSWPFNKEYYLILNMAIGGSFCNNIIEKNDFPCEFIVKSVKIFELE